MQDRTQDEPALNRPACRQFDTDLPAYLEGEARPDLLRHAETCPYCSVILADLEQMRQQAHALPLEEPPARLWANVRSTLAAEGIIREQPRRAAGWFTMAGWGRYAAPLGALASLVVLGAVLLVPPGSLDHSRTSGWLSVADRDAMAARVYRLEDSALANMVGELEQSFDAQQGSLAPSVKAAYLKGLDSLDVSIRECRASVEREPGNTLARQYLVAAYTQKAEVLAAALKFDVP
jgi:hypothetical protein